jgi:crossover junction endodeoxyribonuclease RuvC
MLVLGVDPGTAITGFGIVSETKDEKLIAVDFGVIRTPKGETAGQRLVQLHSELKRLIELHHPEGGAVEKLFFQRNVSTALTVGQARGVALLAMAEVNLSIAEYTPMEVKQAVCGYGGAGKGQVQEMVKLLLGLDDIPKPDDAADALAVAICHINSWKINSISNDHNE